MCIIAIRYFPETGFVGVKNRDRNYKTEVKFKQSFRRGVERLFYIDLKTYFTSGINEHGVTILNTSLSVKKDEKIGSKADKAPKMKKVYAPDGRKIRTALFESTPEKALQHCIDSKLTGNSFIFNRDKAYLLEAVYTNNDTKDFEYKVLKLDKNKSYVRTNHGILLKNAGYQTGTNDEKMEASYQSSMSRYKKAYKALQDVKTPEEMWNCISDSSSDKNPQMNPLRKSKTHGKSILVTTAQILVNPNENSIHYKPIWGDIDVSNFAKINNGKSKCFFEIISARKLLTLESTLGTFKKFMMKHGY